jgi:hypothetical protein
MLASSSRAQQFPGFRRGRRDEAVADHGDVSGEVGQPQSRRFAGNRIAAAAVSGGARIARTISTPPAAW